jgi:hypothetical protein
MHYYLYALAQQLLAPTPNPQPKGDGGGIDLPNVPIPAVPTDKDQVLDPADNLIMGLPPIVWQIVAVLIFIWVIRTILRRLVGK